MNELVSIILPIYNLEDSIQQCLESLVSQTYENIEIVCINDGSTDNSQRKCEEFITNNPDKRIKLYSQENKGVSAARNLGLTKAAGEYVTFVDGDDTLEKEFVEILYQNIKKYDADISCVNLNFIYEKGLKKPYKITKEIMNRNDFYKSLIYEIKGFCANKLYRKALIQNIAFNPEISICEDLLYNVEAGQYLIKAVAQNEYLYNYFQNPTSAYNKKYNARKVTEIDSYNRIIDIVEKASPDNLIFYKLEYTKMAIHQFHQYKDSSFSNEQIYDKIKKSQKKYYHEILKSSFISIKEKILIILLHKFFWLYKILKNLKRMLK